MGTSTVVNNPFRRALELWDSGLVRWIKGQLRDSDNGYCAVGIVCFHGNCVDMEAERFALELLDEVAKEQFRDRSLSDTYKPPTINFNDDPVTEFEDVRLVFEKAAVQWDEQA